MQMQSTMKCACKLSKAEVTMLSILTCQFHFLWEIPVRVSYMPRKLFNFACYKN